MSWINHRGIPLPSPGEDVLQGLFGAFNAAGVFTQADSIEDARSQLSSAEADGVTPTPTNPLLFLIHNNTYISDGSKSVGGQWRLLKMDEVEGVETFYNDGGRITIESGKTYVIMRSGLPARPYDRLVVAWSMGNAQVIQGVAGLVTFINGVDGQVGRWTDTAAMESQSSFNMGIVRANADPRVETGIQAGRGEGQWSIIQMSGSGNTNKLAVLAFPITMG